MNGRPIKPHEFVAVVFNVIIFLILMVIVLWSINRSQHDEQKINILSEQATFHNLTMMLHAAHKRAISLFKMSSLNDPFLIDDEYQNFLSYGEQIIKARESVDKAGVKPDEKEAWERVRGILNKGARIQYAVLDLIDREKRSEAYQALTSELSPLQDFLAADLAYIIALKQDALAQDMKDSVIADEQVYIFIFAIGFIAVLLWIFTFVATNRTARADLELETQAERLSSLYELTSYTGLSLHEQIHATLELGCKLFDLNVGKLCQIDNVEKTNTYVDVVAPSSMNIEINRVFALEKTLTSIPYNENTIVMIHDMMNTEYEVESCCNFTDLGAYIGVPIMVDGEKYGAVNFSSFTPKATPFSEADRDLLHLLGRWIGVTLERQKLNALQSKNIPVEDNNQLSKFA